MGVRSINRELWNNARLLVPASLGLLLIFLGIALEQIVLMALPIALCIGFLMLKDLRWGYYLFFFILPFSIEVYLPNGLGTNLPSEPLMWLLTGCGILWIFLKPKQLESRYILHPITLLIIAHFLWICFSAIHSSVALISIKFLLAKSWYILPFYFIVLFISKGSTFYRSLATGLCLSVLLAILYVMVQHASYGFSFKDINYAVRPFFRNHVNYACLIVISLPFSWYLWKVSKPGTWAKLFWFGTILIFLLGIYFSYTRAAHLSVFIAIASYFIIRFRLMKWAISLTIVGIIGGSSYFLSNERYLNFAPQYEKTITHYQFDDLLSATTRGEDISTMERVYRWVAGWEMFMSRPFTGYGPGTFYSNYRSFTISSFRTYVSHNPDKSGIHNYYLMTLAEQGLMGFLILMTLCFYALIKAEDVYHKCMRNEEKWRVAAIVLSIIIINAILIINDMLEVDKVGPFFFIGLALIVVQDQLNKSRDKKQANLSV